VDVLDAKRYRINRLHPLRRMQRFNCHGTNTLGLNYPAGSNSSDVMKLVIEFIPWFRREAAQRESLTAKKVPVGHH
jgi:hypothetical protein